MQLYMDLYGHAGTREDHIAWILSNLPGIDTRAKAELVFAAVLADGQLVPIWRDDPADPVLAADDDAPQPVRNLGTAAIALSVLGILLVLGQIFPGDLIF